MLQKWTWVWVNSGPVYISKSCPWLKGYPIPPKLIFTECLYAAENLSLPGGWPSFAPQVSQLLTNHVKAFSPRGVTLILQKGWPYSRVTRQGEVKLMQIWFAQGSSAGRVTLLQRTTSRHALRACIIVFIRVNTDVYNK